MKDPCEAAHVGAGAVPHLLVPVVHDPGLPLAVERVRRRQRDVEPLARPVPAPAVHRQEVVGREEAPCGDEDEQPGGGPAGILPPAHPRHPQPGGGGAATPVEPCAAAPAGGRSRESPGSLPWEWDRAG